MPQPETTPPSVPKAALAATPVPPTEAQKTVQSQLVEYSELFEEHGDKLAAASVGNPVIVENLADGSSSYYLVPLFHQDSKPYFIAQVSSSSGKLLRMEGIRSLTPDKENWVFGLLEESALEEKLRNGQSKYAPHSWQSTGRLVWRYCLQSSSPLEPFHELRKGEMIGYMDVRGRIHTELDLPSGNPSGKTTETPGHD